MQSSWGKLRYLKNTMAFFTSFNLPVPRLNAIAAGSAECLGGAALAARALWYASPLYRITFTMTVAYVIAKNELLYTILSSTDKFTDVAPFFLPVAALVLTLSPGNPCLMPCWLVNR